ncbi:hypothetical protein AALP_AAs52473U000100, partial [Arabis alpina]
MLEEITKGPRENLNDLSKEKLGGEPESSSSSKASPTLFGIETRLKQLKEKLNIKSDEDTRVVGVVGMPGIGKTTLAKKLLDDLGCKFMHSMFLDDVHQKSKSLGYYRLQLDLLCGLKRINYDGKVSLESLKDEFSERKVFIVLDDVSAKSEIEDILGNREWLKKGSRVVIITSCKAVVEGMVDETYLVPGLSDNDALKYFEKHAFSGSCEPSFMKHARKVVDYSRGHPLVLKLLGGELLRKDEAHWKSKLRTLVKSPISNTVQNVLRIPYDNLSQYQKDLFLDVACFFRFEDEYYVRSLLDSKVHANVSETRDLADHFFINICGGRLEMNDLMYTLAMGLESQLSSRRRLLNHGEIITVLRNKAEAEKVRGIFLDMSKVPRMSLGSDTFEEMENLRYLKFFDSNSPKICEADCNLNIPDGLKFTLQEIRYFHWLNFPLKNLPGGFKPENLIDLKLPYSEIEKLWEGEKDTPKLKWLDLNHSSKLSTLSGLSLAQKLQSMNLEGCTELKTVQEELQNMESLEFLNLRGCTSLESLPQMDLISLKTLILSGCSSLKEFNMVSENLEELYLDGTAIKGLPSAIGNLQRLVLLTLKDCKELLSLPDSVGNLKALQKLVLSGCSNLASFPEVKETLEHLKTLLLDGTAITEMPHLLHRFSVIQGQTSTWSQYNMRKWPHGIYGLSSLHRLCLSGNKCRSLPSSISYLYHLKWLDLKYCEQLISLPLLPPNLHCLDAHGCSSLENIEGPMALILAETEHSQSSFVFTNCAKLDQVAKNGIISYVRRKIQLMSDAVTHQEKGPTFDVLIKICFPGWHLPTWFNYRSFRSKLNRKLPRNWNEDGLTGIALCAVVSLKDYRSQNTHLLVTCTSEFKEEDKSLIQFSCILGELTEHGKDKPQIITEPSGHVFVGYISLLDIKQQDRGVGCVATKASFKFEVSDGTEHVTNCEVIKCGFTLICAPTKPVQSFCTEEYDDHSHMTSGLRTDSTGGSNMGIERHYKIGSKPNSVLVVATEMGSETEKK